MQRPNRSALGRNTGMNLESLKYRPGMAVGQQSRSHILKGAALSGSFRGVACRNSEGLTATGIP